MIWYGGGERLEEYHALFIYMAIQFSSLIVISTFSSHYTFFKISAGEHAQTNILSSFTSKVLFTTYTQYNLYNVSALQLSKIQSMSFKGMVFFHVNPILVPHLFTETAQEDILHQRTTRECKCTLKLNKLKPHVIFR